MYNKINFYQKQSLKILKFIMRLFVFFMVFGCGVGFASNTYSQTTTLTINVKNKSVKEIFSEIEKNSEYVFFFYDEVLDKERVVSINVKNQKIDVILDKLFENTNNAYLISDRQITISRKPEPFPVYALPALPIEEQQQGINITGMVVDDEGIPLPGVTIFIKGTSKGTATDSDGRFTIAVPDRNTVLVFSYIGFSTIEKTVGNQSSMSVTMEEETAVIDEIVVVGYGVQRKASVVGSIVQASNAELIKSGNVTDLRQSLTGRLPGVITTTSTGEPGGYGDGLSSTSIFIRGRNSWNNSQPLILVDGVERNMDNIDVSEVETISVLKDASSTAVFGVKGGNGVILITTKRGNENRRPEVTASYDCTAMMVSKVPAKLDSYDALRLRNESIERDVSINESLWADYIPYEMLRRYRERDYPDWEWIYPNVDWKKALYKDVGWSHRASLNINGGTDFVKYFGSISYLQENDMFVDYDNHKGYDPNFNFNRFNFRSNLDFNVTRSTVLKVNLAGYISQKNAHRNFATNDVGYNHLVWGAIYRMPPNIFIPQFPDGVWGVSFIQPEWLANPVAQVYNLGILERKTTSLNMDFHLTQNLDFITKGLSVSGSFFSDNSIQLTSMLNDVSNSTRPETGSNTPGYVVYPHKYEGPDQDINEYREFAIINPSNEFDWIVRPWYRETESPRVYPWQGSIGDPIIRRIMYQAKLNYSRKFDLHNIGVMGLFKREENARGSAFPSYREDWIYRATYDYDDRYFIEANGSYNGSERFMAKYRFAFFPSFAAGWYLSNEKFYHIEWLNRVKFRYSIGWVGDDSAGARWLYQTNYAYGGRSRLEVEGGSSNSTSPYSFYRISSVANPNAHWEIAKKSNFGLELGLLQDVISINFDYFTDKRSDMMIAGSSRAVPPYFGATAPASNLGKLDAHGFELQLNLNKRTSIGIEYWASATMTHTRNKVIFKDSPQLLPSYMKAEGYPNGQTKTQMRTTINQNWDDVFASVPQQTNDQFKVPGFYNIIDFDGDGQITSYDSAPYAYPDVPENTYNLTLGASFKGFSATVQFFGVNNVSRSSSLQMYPYDQPTLFEYYASDWWSKDNPNASSPLPRYITQGGVWGNWFMQDGSYVRLKTAEIAYDFQKPVLNRLGVAGLKLYVNGNNLWLWTRLPDDRENTWSGGSSSEGSYPMMMRVNSGIKITF